MEVTKASGEKEQYSRDKFCTSLKKTGAPKELVNRVCEQVESELIPGMTTAELFRKAFSYLSKEHPIVAAKYSLKRAMMEMGPSGFFFEQYLGAVLQEYGYRVKRNQNMRGACGISYEIDLLAKKDRDHFLVEAKYRNKPGMKVDVQVVMYAHARELDIAEKRSRVEGEKSSHYAWVCTNTKFTKNAITYGTCKGIKLTGWKYPRGESLEALIEKKALYPASLLPGVNRFAREQFALKGVLFARDLLHFSSRDFERMFGIYPDAAHAIVREAGALIGVDT
jgi:hypothetical protein